MLHTHSRIWIHLVWTTKKRNPILHKEVGQKLYKHLIDYSISTFNIKFERLNIQIEHVHGLIDLPTDVRLSDYMQKLKGESSFWINQNKLTKNRFSWQRGYGAYSVCASKLEAVKRYIQNQSNHHKKRTFNEEYERWKKEYGIFDK